MWYFIKMTKKTIFLEDNIIKSMLFFVIFLAHYFKNEFWTKKNQNSFINLKMRIQENKAICLITYAF